jgi:hypothetical protein
MPSGDVSPEQVAQWVEKAEEDLISAAHLLKLGATGPLGAVGFHAQQAVEKYVKAVLVARGLVFPKTHDVAKLIARHLDRPAPPLRQKQLLGALPLWCGCGIIVDRVEQHVGVNEDFRVHTTPHAASAVNCGTP